MIAEVFSPPRFAPVVQSQGMRAVSYDIENGFDLSKARVRKQVKQQLREDPPELLVLCPPMY